jgi:hypothetical protein
VQGKVCKMMNAARYITPMPSFIPAALSSRPKHVSASKKKKQGRKQKQKQLTEELQDTHDDFSSAYEKAIIRQNKPFSMVEERQQRQQTKKQNKLKSTHNQPEVTPIATTRKRPISDVSNTVAVKQKYASMVNSCTQPAEPQRKRYKHENLGTASSSVQMQSKAHYPGGPGEEVFMPPEEEDEEEQDSNMLEDEEEQEQDSNVLEDEEEEEQDSNVPEEDLYEELEVKEKPRRRKKVRIEGRSPTARQKKLAQKKQETPEPTEPQKTRKQQKKKTKQVKPVKEKKKNNKKKSSKPKKVQPQEDTNDYKSEEEEEKPKPRTVLEYYIQTYWSLQSNPLTAHEAWDALPQYVSIPGPFCRDHFCKKFTAWKQRQEQGITSTINEYIDTDGIRVIEDDDAEAIIDEKQFAQLLTISAHTDICNPKDIPVGQWSGQMLHNFFCRDCRSDTVHDEPELVNIKDRKHANKYVVEYLCTWRGSGKDSTHTTDTWQTKIDLVQNPKYAVMVNEFDRSRAARETPKGEEHGSLTGAPTQSCVTVPKSVLFGRGIPSEKLRVLPPQITREQVEALGIDPTDIFKDPKEIARSFSERKQALALMQREKMEKLSRATTLEEKRQISQEYNKKIEVM